MRHKCAKCASNRLTNASKASAGNQPVKLARLQPYKRRGETGHKRDNHDIQGAAKGPIGDILWDIWYTANVMKNRRRKT